MSFAPPSSPSCLSSGAVSSPFDDSVTLELRRIHASVARQREWFQLHTRHVHSLVVEADALRGRFFPEVAPLLSSPLQTQTPPRVAPCLLQLTPQWIHSRLGSQTAEARAALEALLPSVLDSLVGLHPTPDAEGATREMARHLFYLLHETLCCLSAAPREGGVGHTHTAPLVRQLLDASKREEVVGMLCSEEHGGEAVEPSVVAEAFQYLATLCM